MDAPSLQRVVEHFGDFGLPYASGLLAAVPEPASAAAIFVCMLGSIGPRRRRAGDF
jgi:hypothetical protein